MNTIDALKRLDRAGDENSRVTEKLHAAAHELAQTIEKLVPINVNLPRGYIVKNVRSNVGSADYLIKRTQCAGEYGPENRDFWIDGTGGYLHGDFHAAIPNQTRAGSLAFAKDIAEGLLDEIAEFLEQRKAESDKAIEVLNNSLSE